MSILLQTNDIEGTYDNVSIGRLNTLDYHSYIVNMLPYCMLV